MLIDLLILLVIAVFILSRLWSILGTRPGPTSPQKTVVLSPSDVVIKKSPPLDPNALYPGFDEHDFLDGAEEACKTILKAYQEGDLKTLRSLVDPDLMDQVFTQKPDEAPSASCLVRSDITKKEKKGKNVFITVRFSVQQVFQSGTIETDDSWTFRKSLETQKSAWMLCGLKARTPEPETQALATVPAAEAKAPAKPKSTSKKPAAKPLKP